MILDGRAVSAAIKDKLTRGLREVGGLGPCGFAVVLAGDDPASRIYAERLIKAAELLGIRGGLARIGGDAPQLELETLLESLNADPAIHGILPMMPLPVGFDSEAIRQILDPKKDVDEITPVSAGLVSMGRSEHAASTPRAVMAILEHYNIPLQGKHAVIIGRSNVVGKPLFHLLLARDATVTVCHSRTQGLEGITKQADILIAAVGQPKIVTAQMVKPGAIVVDVGINEVGGKIVGDVDFDAVSGIAGAITPVPGGVGAVTTMMVMEAVIRNYQVLRKERG